MYLYFLYIYYLLFILYIVVLNVPSSFQPDSNTNSFLNIGSLSVKTSSKIQSKVDKSLLFISFISSLFTFLLIRCEYSKLSLTYLETKLFKLSLAVIFILFFWLGIQIAKKSNDRFAKMTAIGIVFWITFQAFVNMASVAGIFPLAGIPLPFFSYGGSHLVVEIIGVGLLLNISKNT